MKLLSVLDISKEGPEGFILKNINFEVKKYQKTVIAGETGSGKSTLLKTIAGLSQADTGEVIFNGQKVTGSEEQLVPGHPAIAYLSQHFDLPKFLRVEQVLAYANALPVKQAAAIYTICRIDHLMHRKTDQLSGGEKQRIAIARLLITQPKLLLLDEPYSNLDTMVKDILKSVVDDIGRKLRITCLLVSHDPGDTLPWADRIIVLKEGKIIQQGSADEIYRQPVNEYVAGLFGPYVKLTPSLLKVLDIPTGKRQGLARPEDFRVVKSRDAHQWKVREVRFYGHIAELKINCRNVEVQANTTNKRIKAGDFVNVKLVRG
jgi:ABC-type sulfate/molybdate transport systems ATPase subunit